MQTLWLILLTIPVITIDILFLVVFIRYHKAATIANADPQNQQLQHKAARLKRFRNLLMIALVMITLSILLIVLFYPSYAAPTGQEFLLIEEELS